jgi:hypothetical protein
MRRRSSYSRQLLFVGGAYRGVLTKVYRLKLLKNTSPRKAYQISPTEMPDLAEHKTLA